MSFVLVQAFVTVVSTSIGGSCLTDSSVWLNSPMKGDGGRVSLWSLSVFFTYYLEGKVCVECGIGISIYSVCVLELEGDSRNNTGMHQTRTGFCAHLCPLSATTQNSPVSRPVENSVPDRYNRRASSHTVHVTYVTYMLQACWGGGRGGKVTTTFSRLRLRGYEARFDYLPSSSLVDFQFRYASV